MLTREEKWKKHPGEKCLFTGSTRQWEADRSRQLYYMFVPLRRRWSAGGHSGVIHTIKTAVSEGILSPIWDSGFDDGDGGKAKHIKREGGQTDIQTDIQTDKHRQTCHQRKHWLAAGHGARRGVTRARSKQQCLKEISPKCAQTWKCQKNGHILVCVRAHGDRPGLLAMTHVWWSQGKVGMRARTLRRGRNYRMIEVPLCVAWSTGGCSNKDSGRSERRTTIPYEHNQAKTSA